MNEKAGHFSNPNYQPRLDDSGDRSSSFVSRRRGDAGIPSIDASAKIYEKLEQLRSERDDANKNLERLRNERGVAVKSSFKDPLTGCYNRRLLDHLLLDQHFVYNGKTGIIFFDVNNLKIVNDQKGHQAGDELLENTAKFLKDNFREKDMVFRYGGDEFFVIYFADENDDHFKDNLDHKLNSLEPELNSMDVPISLACGTAFYDESRDVGLMDTVVRADLSMLENKIKMKNSRDG